jgi:spore germination protein KA
MIVYIDGLADKALIDRDVIRPLKAGSFSGDVALALSSVYRETKEVPSFIKEVLDGNTAIFFEGSDSIFLSDFKQWEKRAVDTPDNEAWRGGREGFSEASAPIRPCFAGSSRRQTGRGGIRPGRQTNTKNRTRLYRRIVNREVLQEVKDRLAESTSIRFWSRAISSNICRQTPFAAVSIETTQKPDIAAAKILEGRVAVICDGTPHV